MADRTIRFIIPAYNEGSNIAPLLEKTDQKMREKGCRYQIIIINDGSTDDTKDTVEKYAKRMPIQLFNHDGNKGVGEAFRNGFELALKGSSGADVIITKEADNTSDLGILDSMLKKIDEGYDVVLASCYAKGGKVVGTTIDRRILSSIANLFLSIFFPIKGVRTYSSFYRAYRADNLKRAFAAYDNRLIEEKGFVCMVEMLIKLSRLPLQITEIPMILRCDFRKGKSKMNKTRTIATYLRLMTKRFGNDAGIDEIVDRYNNITARPKV
ncbi:MAG: glycosyltransferase [Candidatus Omnitrophica bacterium]|nr:glycosyltransferase [Candidatus Omnitrophota bacterium]MDD5435927.1 glycosyltransferase [Candidatus Omnitrophota bacterium]